MKKKRLFIRLGLIVIAISIFGILATISSHKQFHNKKQKVYAILPLTGFAGQGGQLLQRMINLYLIQNTNSHLEIVYLDSEANPAKAITALNQAIASDKEPLVISAYTAVSAAIIPLVESRGGYTFAVTTSGTTEISQNSKYQLFSYSPEDYKLIADYVLKKYQHGVVVYSNDEYGFAGNTYFRKEYLSGNNECVSIPYQPSDSGVRETIQKALDYKPDFIVVISSVTSKYIELFKQLKMMSYEGEIIADIVFSYPPIYSALESLANGIVFMGLDVDLSYPLTKEGQQFRRLCVENGIPPYFAMVQAYDMMKAIDYCLDQKIPFSSKSILASQHGFSGVIGDVKFTPDGITHYPYILVRYENGIISPANQ